jgi:hypothetical protein
MKFYRVETEGGTGAFYGTAGLLSRLEKEIGDEGLEHDEGGWWLKDPYRHPGPCDAREAPALRALFDGPCGGRLYKFGFTSRKALLRWFDSEALRRKLNRNGTLAVSVYDVPASAVVRGTYQAVCKQRYLEPCMRKDRAPFPVLRGRA